MQVTWLDPPDLTFPFEGTTIGVAVKRIWSRSNAVKRVYAGVPQLQEAGLRGLIAINVQQYLTALPPREPSAEKAAVRQATDPLLGLLPKLLDQPPVLGMFLASMVVDWDHRGASKHPRVHEQIDVQHSYDDPLSISLYKYLTTVVAANHGAWRLRHFAK